MRLDYLFSSEGLNSLFCGNFCFFVKFTLLLRLNSFLRWRKSIGSVETEGKCKFSAKFNVDELREIEW